MNSYLPVHPSISASIQHWHQHPSLSALPSLQQPHNLHISCRYSKSVTGAFEPQTMVFPHCSLTIPSSAAERGVWMLSHSRQSEIQPYVTNRCQLLLQRGGVQGSRKLTYQKDVAATYLPRSSSFSIQPALCSISPPFLHRPVIFDHQYKYYTSPLYSPALCTLFNGPVNCHFRLFKGCLQEREGHTGVRLHTVATTIRLFV